MELMEEGRWVMVTLSRFGRRLRGVNSPESLNRNVRLIISVHRTSTLKGMKEDNVHIP